MSRKLVAYFSATGRTRRAAEKIAAEEGAELYEIRPAVPYEKGDLNYMSKKSRTSLEMNDESSRPELEEDGFDIGDYDEIWVGFPIWWYTVPHVVLTFLESRDFSGKTIRPFATSGGSGFGSIVERLKQSAPGAEILPGKMVR